MSKNSLDKLMPSKTPIVVKIDGQDVTFERIRVRHLSRFVSIVEAIDQAIADDDQDALVVNHLGEVVELIAMCTGKSIDECGDMPVDSINEALSAIFEVNKDFFVRAAKKRLAAKEKEAQEQKPATSGTLTA